MRRTLLAGWLMLLPMGGLYHLVAGPAHREMDLIGDSLREAREHVQNEQWFDAVPAFEKALEGMPEELMLESRAVRLELAQAKMNASKLPDAHADLKGLLDELLAEKDAAGTKDSNSGQTPADSQATAKLEREVRETLANSQFYMTWLMRLEGLPATEWEPEIESARQNYRMLAATAEQSGDTEAVKEQQKNLEAAIKLARLDLGDLQGLPLPNQ